MKFIVLGDLHFSEYVLPEQEVARDQFFSLLFRQVGLEEADLVFAIGDTTNKGSETELKMLKALASSNSVNLFSIMGNHDCLEREKKSIANYFLGGQPSASSEAVYCSFDKGDIRFLVLDTAREKDDEDYSGFVGSKQLDWLKHKIIETNSLLNIKRIVVLAHHPIENTTSRSEKWGLRINNSEEVLEILSLIDGSKLTTLYCCGHNHQHSIINDESIDFCHIQTAPPLDCCSYRVIELHHEHSTIQTRNINFDNDSDRSAFEISRTTIPEKYAYQSTEIASGDNNSDREANF